MVTKREGESFEREGHILLLFYFTLSCFVNEGKEGKLFSFFGTERVEVKCVTFVKEWKYGFSW